MHSKKKINSLPSKGRILLSPLDWGLGHATRCIPIIKELLLYDCEMFIATNGPCYSLLKKEFPGVKFLPLTGYHIKLSSTKTFFSFKILSQLPKIFLSIYKEKKWLKQTIRKHNINAVISDNRPGLYNKNVYSVYITHQLSIKTGNTFTSKIARQIHHFFIKKYNECWVPDFATNGLAGKLSHPYSILNNVKYIGALSRFDKINYADKKYDLAIILSGPEPQRTFLEDLLLKDLASYKEKALLVRGLPSNSSMIKNENNSLEIVNHLSAEELGYAMQQSSLIISRSGYTTVMDLVMQKKNALLIPTPGQAEQEYLANYLSEKKYFLKEQQQGFNLKEALEKFRDFSNHIPEFDMEQYKPVIKKFVKTLTDEP